MAQYGHIIWKTCNEEILLGKWLCNENNEGIGFWHGELCKEGESDSHLLGKKVLRFIAKHMNHELLSASDEGGLYDEYVDQNNPIDNDDYWDEITKN